MPTLLSWFFESGILSKLSYFEKYSIMLKRRKGTAVVRSRMHPVQPIHLSDSIHTVFILYAVLISLAVLGLVTELYVQTFNRIIILNIQICVLKRELKRGFNKVRRRFYFVFNRFSECVCKCELTFIKAVTKQ